MFSILHGLKIEFYSPYYDYGWNLLEIFRIYGKVLGIYLKYFSTPSLPSALKWEAWTLGDNGMGDPEHQHGAGAWAWVWVRINFCLYYFIFLLREVYKLKFHKLWKYRLLDFLKILKF